MILITLRTQLTPMLIILLMIPVTVTIVITMMILITEKAKTRETADFCKKSTRDTRWLHVVYARDRRWQNQVHKRDKIWQHEITRGARTDFAWSQTTSGAPQQESQLSLRTPVAFIISLLVYLGKSNICKNGLQVADAGKAKAKTFTLQRGL